ncbi:MAG: GAF domain-containing protein, partial [Planctomycetota bacterium]|nr:GAF domain-containing protein [Planctomycetota bacterium]
QEVANPVERVLREGLIVGLANHTLLINRQGREIPIADSAAPVRDEKGRLTGVVLVFRDQSEERAAERLLRESERLLRISNERNSFLAHAATALLESDDAIKEIASLCGQAMPAIDCQIYLLFLLSDDGQRLNLTFYDGLSAEDTSQIASLHIGQGVCGNVAQSGQRMVLEDIQAQSEERLRLLKAFGVQSCCCHPLKAGGRTFGTLLFGSRTQIRLD